MAMIKMPNIDLHNSKQKTNECATLPHKHWVWYQSRIEWPLWNIHFSNANGYFSFYEDCYYYYRNLLWVTHPLKSGLSCLMRKYRARKIRNKK